MDDAEQGHGFPGLIERQRDTAQREQWMYLWAQSVPALFRDAHKNVDVPHAHRDLLNDFHAGHPSGLILTGPVGTGKTHEAYAIVNTLVEYGITHPSRILAGRESLILAEAVHGSWQARSDARTKLHHPLLKVVLVDDVGHSTWRHPQDRWSVWTDLTDHLLANSGFLIVTSNLDITHLMEWMGEAAGDRLKALTRGTAKIVNGQDHRSRKFGPPTPEPQPPVAGTPPGNTSTR